MYSLDNDVVLKFSHAEDKISRVFMSACDGKDTEATLLVKVERKLLMSVGCSCSLFISASNVVSLVYLLVWVCFPGYVY